MPVLQSATATFTELMQRATLERDSLDGMIAAARGGNVHAIDELYAVWRGARDDETIALGAWARARDSESYAVYRAASDRADAAQAVLASSCRPRLR